MSDGVSGELIRYKSGRRRERKERQNGKKRSYINQA
jgi:hypothetical protein